MKRFLTITLPLAIIGACTILTFSPQSAYSDDATVEKKPENNSEVPKGYQTATFSAGCYWCVEAVFQRIDGVHTVVSGFTGGKTENPKYEDVVQETTGHAEAVQIVFDPEKISYEKLLAWFWKAHDPTQLNRQGADVGTHYRSGIFYHNDDQKNQATQSRTKAQAGFSQPIVTEITEAAKFYPAKVSHQDYYRINGNTDGYCRLVIEPKLEKLNLKK